MSAMPVNQKLNPPKSKPALTQNLRNRSSLIERYFRSRIRLTQLRLLVAVEDLGQLKKVAEKLSVTPPAISKQVAEIEEALQLPILRRVGNRLEFTEFGSLLARHARQILRQLELARLEVDTLCSGVIGKVGLGAVPTVAPFLLPAIVIHLREFSPNVAIRLEEGRFNTLAPLIEDSTLDIALIRDAGQLLPKNFLSETVFSDPLAVVCGSQHPLAARKRLHWRDLDGSPWLLPLKGSTTFIELEHLMASHGQSFAAGSIESLPLAVNISLLQALPFVALVPLAYAQRYLNEDIIKILPLSTGGMQSAIHVIWRRDNSNPLVGPLLKAIRTRTISL
jgi:DNA-binding transcriptional LysR family regulator